MLTLEQLCGYLPYKLKIKRGERNLVMNTGQGSSVHWIGISSVLKWQNVGTRPMPLLRSLDKLTEPITVDGWGNNKPFYVKNLLLEPNLVDAWMESDKSQAPNFRRTDLELLYRLHFAINISPEDYIEIE